MDFQTGQTVRFDGLSLKLHRKLSRRPTFQAFDTRQRVNRVLSVYPTCDDTRRRFQAWRSLDALKSPLPKLISSHRLGSNQMVSIAHWIDGQSLAGYLQHLRSHREDWPSLFQTVRLYRMFVHGLSQLHSRSLIHGDISSHNLILNGPKPTQLRLIDCGSEI